MHGVRTKDLPVQSRYREAAFVVEPLPRRLHDDVGDDHVGTVALVVDEESFLNADLIGGEPDARGVVHGLDHRLREGGDLGVDVLNLGRRRGQHRVTVDSNGQRTHSIRLPPAKSRPTRSDVPGLSRWCLDDSTYCTATRNFCAGRSTLLSAFVNVVTSLARTREPVCVRCTLTTPSEGSA